jgi:hypothetical protein
MEHRWTHGAATDIRVRWPACSHWDTLLPDWWNHKEHDESPEALNIAADWWLDRGDEEKADFLRRASELLAKRQAAVKESAAAIKAFNVKHLESRP